MTQDKSKADEETISLEDMRSALVKESRAVMRAADLRVRGLSQITLSYAAGEITPQEATKQYLDHQDKWGDPLPGVMRDTTNATDEQIKADMDRAFSNHVERLRTSVKTDVLPRSRG